MNATPPRSLQAIDFSQSAQCLTALRSLNPTDTDDTQVALSQLLEGMIGRPPEPIAHIQVLEEMRTTLDFVQTQAALRYASRPLPPSSNEEETLQRVLTLWTDMARSYALIAQRAALDPAFAERRALVTHRRMQYSALTMIEYFRARREIPPGLWRGLHAQFVAAERSGVADVRVPDVLNEVWGAQSSLEAYVAMLLVDASSPYSRTPREFVWLARWAQRFAPYCGLLKEFGATKSSIYCLDLDADHGLRPAGLLPPDATLRGLDTQKLAAHIQAVVSQLKKGVAAASLGLGEDCVQPACARLLVSLYRPWGLASAGRKFPRRSLRGQVKVATDPLAIAFFIDGREFTQPTDVRRSSFSDTQVFRAFDRLDYDDNEASLQERALQLGYVQEAWDVADQSVAGYRLTRRRGDSRVEHRQLVGLRGENDEKMLLAELSWLQYQQNGALYAGVSLMPGPAQVVAVKLLLNERTSRERYRLGFLIPGVPTMKTEMSLVVPAGWFLAERRVEVRSESTWNARMTKLVSRGSNFDRVYFVREEVPDADDN